MRQWPKADWFFTRIHLNRRSRCEHLTDYRPLNASQRGRAIVARSANDAVRVGLIRALGLPATAATDHGVWTIGDDTNSSTNYYPTRFVLFRLLDVIWTRLVRTSIVGWWVSGRETASFTSLHRLSQRSGLSGPQVSYLFMGFVLFHQTHPLVFPVRQVQNI